MLTFESQADRNVADELRAYVWGGVALPSDQTYADACRVWNGAVHRCPTIIAFCERTGDVQAAVCVAPRHGLPLSMRGGGHDWAGRALCQAGLVLDLTGMWDAVVAPQVWVATVAGGARIKGVAAAAHGLVAALGNCGVVSLDGLILGGGYDPPNGNCGLAADNLLGAEMVLADRRCVTAGPDEEHNLFRELQGGDFGVVTSMRFHLHEGRDILAGSILYPWGEVEDVLRRYTVFAATMPDELCVSMAMMSGPDGQLAVLRIPQWTGDKRRGERAMGDLQAFGTPQLAQTGPTTYPDMLAQFDPHLADDGRHWELRTRSLPELTPGAVAAIVDAVSRKRSPHSAVNWPHFHGAATRLAPDATALGLCRGNFILELVAIWKPDGAVTARCTADGRRTSGATSSCPPCPTAMPTYWGRLTASRRGMRMAATPVGSGRSNAASTPTACSPPLSRWRGVILSCWSPLLVNCPPIHSCDCQEQATMEQNDNVTTNSTLNGLETRKHTEPNEFLVSPRHPDQWRSICLRRMIALGRVFYNSRVSDNCSTSIDRPRSYRSHAPRGRRNHDDGCALIRWRSGDFDRPRKRKRRKQL